MKIYFNFDKNVPASVFASALILTKKKISISCDGQRHFHLKRTQLINVNTPIKTNVKTPTDTNTVRSSKTNVKTAKKFFFCVCAMELTQCSFCICFCYQHGLILLC